MPRHKEFEREDVLEKALGVFWSKGYNATSFQDLTAGMCVNRQSIYDTYGDKHTLFIEALRHYYNRMTAIVSEHFSQDKPLKELLTSYFNKQLIGRDSERKTRGCFMVNSTVEMASHDEEVNVLVNQFIEDLTRIFKAAINRSIKSGEIISERSPASSALYLVNTLYGIKALERTIADKKKLRDIADMAINALVRVQ
jgi:TetR/AcrR family transcriptional repressor of nem operon